MVEFLLAVAVLVIRNSMMTMTEFIERYGEPHGNQLTRIPKAVDVPAGAGIVHNYIVPVARKVGTRGSRIWVQSLDDSNGPPLEVCPCRWAPELGRHYRVPRTPGLWTKRDGSNVDAETLALVRLSNRSKRYRERVRREELENAREFLPGSRGVERKRIRQYIADLENLGTHDLIWAHLGVVLIGRGEG
jgi:hypothetical protein